jgi:hypothetical protein
MKSVQIMAKYFRHQDAKTQRLLLSQKVTRLPLCLGAFVAIYFPPVADPV